MKLCIISGRPRYGDIDILKDDALGVDITDSFPVSSRMKGLNASEPATQFGDVTFQQAKVNILRTLADPKSAAKNFSEGLSSALITEPPFRLIMEDDFRPAGLESMMATKDVIDQILKMDSDAMTIFPRDIDPYTMYDDA